MAVAVAVASGHGDLLVAGSSLPEQGALGGEADGGGVLGDFLGADNPGRLAGLTVVAAVVRTVPETGLQAAAAKVVHQEVSGHGAVGGAGCGLTAGVAQHSTGDSQVRPVQYSRAVL